MRGPELFFVICIAPTVKFITFFNQWNESFSLEFEGSFTTHSRNCPTDLNNFLA
jgi:hypothetical protein